MLVQQIINGIVVGSVYALTAMGATLVYGIMRILDISNAGAYAIGAYVAFFFLLQTGSPLVALVTGVALTAVFGFLVQKFLYAPLMNKSPNVSLIAGIGLFIFLQDFLRLVAGPQARELNFGTLLPSIQFPSQQLTLYGTWFLILAATAILLLILWLLLNRSSIGLAWRATAQDLKRPRRWGSIPTGWSPSTSFSVMALPQSPESWSASSITRSIRRWAMCRPIRCWR